MKNEDKVIEIYWEDLKEETQKEIINILGDNGNFDVFPIAVIDYSDWE